jgi:hypothetical protein
MQSDPWGARHGGEGRVVLRGWRDTIACHTLAEGCLYRGDAGRTGRPHLPGYRVRGHVRACEAATKVAASITVGGSNRHHRAEAAT